MAESKKIILGITGGIAAYKTPELVRRLRDRGAEVQVVMTRSAQEFVTETTLQAVSGLPVAARGRCGPRSSYYPLSGDGSTIGHRTGYESCDVVESRCAVEPAGA